MTKLTKPASINEALNSIVREQAEQMRKDSNYHEALLVGPLDIDKTFVWADDETKWKLKDA